MSTTPNPEPLRTPDGHRILTVDWQRFNLVDSANLWFTVSGVLLALGLLFMGLNITKYGAPFRLGIDFTGGTLISFQYEGEAARNVSPAQIESIVRAIDQQAPTVQVSGGEESRTVLIRASAALAGSEGADKLQELYRQLEAEYGKPVPETESISEVTATISGELVAKAIEGLFWGLLLVFIYVTLRMRLDFAAFGIMALLHDVGMATGFMAAMSYLFGWEINSWFVAVILTIVGYSINDTIVVYDRVRENLNLYPAVPFPRLVNFSLNQTLARSVYTSLTVWFVLAAMLIGQMLEGGAGGLKEFNAVMLAGMVAGAYSSIFVAAQALVAYYRSQEQHGKHGFVARKEEPGTATTHSPVIAQMHRLDETGVAPGEAAEGAAAAAPVRKTVKGSEILGTIRPVTPGPGGSGTGSRSKKKRW